MRNKNIFTIIFFFIYLFLPFYSISSESFNFDVTEIEIKENGNKFIGKNNGTATSIDGTKIDANNFEYNKIKNILISSGKVKIFDPKNNITIYSDKVTYFKNDELIIANGNSKAIGTDFQIDAKNFEYNKLKNIIYAENKVKIDNKKEKYLIFSDEITYFKNDELIIANGNSKAIDDQVEIDAKNFEYNKLKNIIYAENKVKIDNKKEKYLIFSDEITYFKNDELIIANGNSKAIDDQVEIDAKNFEYNKLSNIIFASGNVKINNKKENYLIFSDNITYNKKIGKVFTKNNSQAISEGMVINADLFTYDEKKNLLEAKGKVKIEDEIEDYILESEYINYDRNLQKIFTRGKTKALIEKKYEFNSKNVFLDRKLKKLKSDNFSTIEDDNFNFYKLSKLLYFFDKKLLRGNDVEVETNYKKEKNDKFFFKNAFINFFDNSYISKDTKVNIHKKVFDKERDLEEDQENIFAGENDPRIYGSSSFGNEDIVVLNKAIFTSCKKNDNCPPWSIKADTITHDRVNQNIHYKNAILNLYDVPVFYFPKFFHPDPSVERRSGLLQPRLNNSNVLGSSIHMPYFHVISDNKDLTFKPTIFDNRIYMFQNEYRQENKNSSFIADFSYLKGYQSKISGNDYSNRNSISHLFSKFDLDLGLKDFATSKLNFFLEKVNNDTYLKVFENVLFVDKDKLEKDLKDKNNLTSGVKLILDNDDYNFTTGLTMYENLQKNNNDRYQQVLPYYDFSTSLFSDENGSLELNSNGRNTLQNTNNLRSTLTNTLSYSTIDNFTENGFVNNFGIYFKNLNATGKNDTKYKSSLQSELLNIYEFNTRYPLFKEDELVSNYITPKVSFRLNPSDMKNYSTQNRLITTDNIFNINRLGISDSYESGKSLTFGIDFKKEKKEDIEKYLEIKFATVLRDSEENKIPTSSSLNRSTSNLFGSVENSFSEFFSLNYDFAIDNDFNKFEHNSIETEFTVNNFVTTFNFLEKSGEMGDVNTIENTTKISFDDQNSLIFKTRRNRKISLTEYYDLVYEYQNDCLTAGIKYRKTYYQDRDLKPKEDLFFTITLFPLTSLDQKVDNSLYSN